MELWLYYVWLQIPLSFFINKWNYSGYDGGGGGGVSNGGSDCIKIMSDYL